jgi:hypothetical protein
MTKLVRPQLAQKVDTTEFDDVTIITLERLVRQQVVNGFAGADEIRGFLSSWKHGGFSLRTGTQGVREGVCSLTAPPEKRYRTCLVRTFY